jgi:hypothetical protein
MIKILNRIWLITVIFFTISLINTSCDKLSDQEFICPETVHGVVKDMSHIDGCGLVIELDDGTYVIPNQLDTSMMLAEGQEVEIAYTELSVTNNPCPVGPVADVTWLEQAGCSPIIIQRMDNTSVYSSLPADPFTIKDAKIKNDCLEILVSFSGGCEVHEFIMTYTELPAFSNYSGTLTLGHNSHGDKCEALITQTISFNLAPLQLKGANMIRLVLVKAEDKDDYKLIIDYYYK